MPEETILVSVAKLQELKAQVAIVNKNIARFKEELAKITAIKDAAFARIETLEAMLRAKK